jgi:hypothetical protein
MTRFLTLLCALIAGASLSGCGTAAAKTNSFVSEPGVTALLTMPSGGLMYGTSAGKIFEVDKDGKPVASATQTVVDGAPANEVLGLALDSKNRTFASWRDTQTQKLVIGQVLPGPTRIVFRSDELMASGSRARLAVSPENRLVVTFTPQGSSSQVLSVDPDRDADQKANMLSTNWHALGGIAYSAGHVLWAVDGGDDDRVARVGPDGPTGDATDTKQSGLPSAMTAYGDSELVACFSKPGSLQRFFISDGIQAMIGRKLADDCTGDVAELKDGRIVYVAGSEIRATAL